MNKNHIVCSFENEYRGNFDCSKCEYTQGVNLVKLTERKYKGVPYVEKDGIKHYSCPHGREAI